MGELEQSSFERSLPAKGVQQIRRFYSRTARPSIIKANSSLEQHSSLQAAQLISSVLEKPISDRLTQRRERQPIQMSTKTQDFLESLGISKSAFDLKVSKTAQHLTFRQNLLHSGHPSKISYRKFKPVFIHNQEFDQNEQGISPQKSKFFASNSVQLDANKIHLDSHQENSQLTSNRNTPYKKYIQRVSYKSKYSSQQPGQPDLVLNRGVQSKKGSVANIAIDHRRGSIKLGLKSSLDLGTQTEATKVQHPSIKQKIIK